MGGRAARYLLCQLKHIFSKLLSPLSLKHHDWNQLSCQPTRYGSMEEISQLSESVPKIMCRVHFSNQARIKNLKCETPPPCWGWVSQKMRFSSMKVFGKNGGKHFWKKRFFWAVAFSDGWESWWWVELSFSRSDFDKQPTNDHGPLMSEDEDTPTLFFLCFENFLCLLSETDKWPAPRQRANSPCNWIALTL